MANNPNLYNAVIAGATGANQQRWLTSSVQANYTDFQGAVVALAGAVDDAIPVISGDASAAQAALMQSIVQGIFADRFVQSAQQATYESIVGPIVALWNELGEALEPVAGVSADPLSMLYWTDPLTALAPADQTGYIAAPFESLQAAWDAAFAASGDVGGIPCLLLQPMVYTGDITDAVGVEVNLYGLGVTQGNLGGNINGDLIGAGSGTVWTLERVFLTGNATAAFGTVRMRGGGQAGSPGIDCQTFVAEEGAVIENVTAGGLDIKQGCFITTANAVNIFIPPATFVDDSTIGTLISAGGSLTATYSAFGTIDGVANITCQWCDVSVILNAETVILENCFISGGAAEINCTGDLTIDSVTYQRAVSDGVTFNVGGNIIFSDAPLSITANVVVPAVAADAVGYVDVALAGTELEDLFAIGDPVIVNPQSDLVAAGAGGGYLNARVSALNTVRLCFQGALAGGAADFTISRNN